MQVKVIDALQPVLIRVMRVNPRTARGLCTFHQPQEVLEAHFRNKIVLLQFADRIQVLEDTSL